MEPAFVKDGMVAGFDEPGGEVNISHVGVSGSVPNDNAREVVVV